jgi:hypothetical protein
LGGFFLINLANTFPLMKCITEKTIGITNTDCACITNNLPAGYNESLTGIYLDQVDDFLDLSAFKAGGECLSMAQILTRSRSTAYADFKRDLFKILQTRFKSRDKDFSGQLGSKAFNSSLATGAAFAGVEITAMPYKGAVMKLTGFYASFNYTGAIDILILQTYQGEEDTFYQVGDPITIQATNGQLVKTDLTEPVDLPLYDDTGKILKYYFRYSTEGGLITPKNNNLNCGCGSVENDAKKFVSWSGFTSNLAGDLSSITHMAYMMGINPVVEIKCGSEEMICSQFNNDELTKEVIGWILAYKAAANALDKLLISPVVNRYTMTDREGMTYLAARLRKKYNNDLQYLTDNMDLGSFDCFLCKDATDAFYMGKIKL